MTHEQKARTLAEKIRNNYSMRLSNVGLAEFSAFIAEALRAAHDAGVKEGRELGFKEGAEWAGECEDN